MKNEKFIRSISEIGDDLINEAASYGEEDQKAQKTARRVKIFRRTALIAASLALVITLGFLIPPLFGGAPTVSGPEPVSGAESDETSREPITFIDGSGYKSDSAGELPEALREAKLLANGNTQKLIPTDTTLVLRTNAECDTQTLVSYLTVTPSLPLAVTQVSATEFHVSPAQTTFAPNTVYRFTLGDPENPAVSYAFQTVNELSVKSILPGAGSSGVPVDTGIEVTFTDAVQNADFSEFITVSPKIEGSFMLYPDLKTVAFIPEKKLEYGATYTVTVKPGVTSLAGKVLSEGRVSVFRTLTEEPSEGKRYDISLRPRNEHFYHRNVVDETYSLGEPVDYYVDTRFDPYAENPEYELTARLYRSVTWEAAFEYISENYRRGVIGDLNREELEKYFVEAPSETVGEFSRDEIYSSLAFDVSLFPKEEGVYYFEVTVKNGDIVCTAHDFFQVSSLRIGGAGCNGSTMICAFDDTGSLVEGVKIEGLSFEYGDLYETAEGITTTSFSAVTDGDGKAVVQNGNDNALLFICSRGESKAIAFKGVAGAETEEMFIKYIYTDRSVYFKSDTVNVWGVITGLDGARVPDTVYVYTGLSSVGTPAKVSEDGFFTASVSYEKAAVRHVYLRVEDGEGRVLATTGFGITPEEKPVLKADIAFDKPYCRHGETIRATVNVTFFDGTPADGYYVTVKCEDFGASYDGMVENGRISLDINTQTLKQDYTGVRRVQVTARISGEGTARFDISGYFDYFNSDYVFGCSNGRVTLNELDLSGYPSNVTGAPAEGTVRCELVKVVYFEATRTTYDKYRKRNVEIKYRESREIQVKEETLRFENGVIELPDMDIDPDKYYYYYNVFFTDGINVYKRTVYSGFGSLTGNYGVSIFGNFNFDKETYAVGDTLTARFVKPDVSDVMIVFCYNGRMEYHAGPVAAITVTEEMLPQIQARAIFFDKSKSYFVNGLYRSINYDIGACAMTEMSVTADKEVYSPGEDAVITVRAPELGGGAALVSIVDEACLSLGDNAPDIASYFRSAGYYTSSSVYSFMDSGYPYSPDNKLKHLGFLYAFADLPVTPASGALPTLNSLEDDVGRNAEEPGATAAEKNAFYVRENFADNPVFSVVRLNAEGEGTLVCKVPDNITSWRITAIAVLNGGSISGIKAAQCVSDTVCTLPFFVRAEIRSRYVLGDDVAISAHCFGSGAKGEVAYTAVLCDTDGETLDTITASGEAGVFTAMNFGKRETGGYSVILYAECGGYKDAVKHTFDLVSSDHTVTVSKTVSLSELGDITPAEYPVCVTVSGDDGSGGQYERVISRLNGMRSHDGARVDALAAEYAAKTAFHALTGGEFDSADIAALIPQYRDAATGFFKLFPYAEPDTELTALIADIAPDLISDKTRAINSFWQKINTDKIYDSSEYCASVYGLAALGEPVLDILYALASKEDLPVTAQLYTACGFAAAGDYGAADIIYGRVKEIRYSQELDSLHFENGAMEGTVKATSLALIAASRIRRKDAVAITRWLASIPNAHSESGDLALAAFIRFFLPAGEIDTRTVSYTLADGVTRQARLGYAKKLTLTLYKDDFESLSLENCDGALISVRYGGALSELGKEYDTGRIKVEKYCYPTGLRLVISGVTSLVDETLRIEDLLPTGTRFVSAERVIFSAGNVSGGSLRAGAGQELTGYIYVHNKDASADAGDYCEEYAFRAELVCHYNTAIPGEYAVVPALVRSLCTGEYAVSQSGDTRIIE